MNMEGREKGKLAAALRSFPSVQMGVHTPISVKVSLATSGGQEGSLTEAPVQLAEQQSKFQRQDNQLVSWVEAQSDETCSLILAVACARSPQVALFHILESKPKSLLAEKEQPNCFSLDFTKCAILTLAAAPSTWNFFKTSRVFYFLRRNAAPRPL